MASKSQRSKINNLHVVCLKIHTLYTKALVENVKVFRKDIMHTSFDPGSLKIKNKGLNTPSFKPEYFIKKNANYHI